MYWYKVKSALILLFLAINIFLLARIGYVAWNEKNRENENLSSIVSVLQSNDIIILENIVPLKSPRLKSLTVANVFADENIFASALLGTDIILVDESGQKFSSGTRTLSLSGSRFHYQNSGAGANVTPNEENAAQCAAQLSQMGFYTEGIKWTCDTTRIVYRLAPDGVPLFDATISVIPGEKGIVSISGSWVTPTINNDVITELRPASDALIEFFRDPARPVVGCEVKSVEAGYSIWLGDNSVNYKTAEAVPVWRIRLTDGQSFYYDAR